MKKLATLVGSLALVVPLSGCYTFEHQVGTGAQGGAEVEERQWFWLWGLLKMNDVDSHALAAGATNYDVKTEFNVVDVIIGIFTGWVSIYSQTVTVTK